MYSLLSLILNFFFLSSSLAIYDLEKDIQQRFCETLKSSTNFTYTKCPSDERGQVICLMSVSTSGSSNTSGYEKNVTTIRHSWPEAQFLPPSPPFKIVDKQVTRIAIFPNGSVVLFKDDDHRYFLMDRKRTLSFKTKEDLGSYSLILGDKLQVVAKKTSPISFSINKSSNDSLFDPEGTETPFVFVKQSFDVVKVVKYIPDMNGNLLFPDGQFPVGFIDANNDWILVTPEMERIRIEMHDEKPIDKKFYYEKTKDAFGCKSLADGSDGGARQQAEENKMVYRVQVIIYWIIIVALMLAVVVTIGIWRYRHPGLFTSNDKTIKCKRLD